MRKMHGDDGTNDTREINATDVTNSILYTILMNDFATVSSTSMTSTIYNESTSTTTYADLSQESGQRLWNLSRTAVTSLSETTAVPFNATRSTTAYTSSTTDSYDEFGPPEGVEYIFVPLGVVVSVIILSAVVWVLIISRKRKLERLRHRLMPMYNFDPGEEEEDDWETELLDECYNTHQRRIVSSPIR
ncbi:uncharacterized protein C3orf18 isoform X5 [Ooceraea biroi]|uniref:uncharacterized protein C3orf18 isoform X5 n=1 Tax=Ooceraea biroi TaxID=2015173 RepID=UPI0005B79303|nr:uncharacterized protein C3orf18 isoform X5 [Ooceraea biroi]